MAEEQYDEIRTKLGVGAEDLSDVEIDRESPVVIVKLKKRIPTWQSLSGDDETFFAAATVAAIAAVCCPILKTKMPSQEDTPFYKNRTAQNWNVRAAELRAESEEYLASITGYGLTSPTIFGLAGPTRSGAYG